MTLFRKTINRQTDAPPAVEICILAGGLSSRMRREKARMRLQGRTLLGWGRRIGREMNLPARVIRRDLVARSGPLGGIFTALKTTQTEAVLFLACDMPFVSAELIEVLIRRLRAKRGAVFTQHDQGAGFPFLLRRTLIGMVEKQLAAKEFSLQALARRSHAARVTAPMRERWRLLNINTPADWAAAQEIILQRYGQGEKNRKKQ